MPGFTKDFKENLFTAFYEFLLVIAPIAIYVALEAMHKKCLFYFFESPEWAVAIIFLMFTASSNYIKNIVAKKKEMNVNITLLNFYFFLTVIFTIAAILNAQLSMHQETNNQKTFRLILFVFSTILFFLMMTKPDK